MARIIVDNIVAITEDAEQLLEEMKDVECSTLTADGLAVRLQTLKLYVPELTG